MKILIADDDASSRRMLELVLGRLGYEIITEANGLSALKILCEPDPPQLAVLDWVMPGLDGNQVCRTLRQRNPDSAAYLILLTSKSEHKDIVVGLDSGADDYIVKPFNVNELQSRLRIGEKNVAIRQELLAAKQELKYLRSMISASPTGTVTDGPPPRAATPQVAH